MVEENAKVTQTKMMARVSNNQAMNALCRAVDIAVAQKRRVITSYERDYADYVCWVVHID